MIRIDVKRVSYHPVKCGNVQEIFKEIGKGARKKDDIIY